MPAPLPDPHSEAVLSRAAPPPDHTRSYGPDAAQVYDVRLPHRPPRGPVVHRGSILFVHGGFWRAAYDRTHAGAAADALARAGFHVAVGEYRRAGLPGGGVPGTLDDLTALVAAVAQDPQLPGPLVLVGHSAGGHLVAWAANHAWATRSAGILALGGCLDLAATDRLGLGANAARDFVGGGPEEAPAAWALADPMTSLPPRVPVRLLHGALDREVPLEVNDAYLARCHDLRADVRLDVVDDAGHYSLIHPEHPAWSHTLAAVTSLIHPS